MDRQGVSFTLGQRLKDLREERGLSHIELIKQLSDKYGTSISRDSLMAYEIADETRAKASKLPNLGMRVEYLYCLADFFEVSIDYLLGKTDTKSVEYNIQSACGYTGLSEAAITMIRTLAVEDVFCHAELDELIQNREVLLALVRYIVTVPVDGYLIVDKVGGIRSAKPRDELGPVDLEKFPVSEIIESALQKDLMQKIDKMRNKQKIRPWYLQSRDGHRGNKL